MGKKNRTEPFLAQMIDLLGPAEAPLLLDVLQFPAMKSVRYNATKCSASECPGIQVPWCADYGRYWDNAEFPSLPSRTIEYAAGNYYIQEASAMLAVSVAARVIHFAGKTVLDLCAAPGGKTTQAAELTGNGFVLANEVIGKRVDALIWNVNRHRLHNVIITSLTSERLAQMLPGFFDIVIVDAPCSG